MKTRNNNSTISPVTWVGQQYEPEIRGFKHRTAFFYSKCIFGAMTLEVGNYVLVSNIDAAEPDSIDGCDVARIMHMYELSNVEHTNMDLCRAIVQWYSRPAGMPNSISSDENYSFHPNEVIEDSRFNPDISIETIFSSCRLEIVAPKANLAVVLSKSTSRCPVFFARYKVEKSSARKWHLSPLLPANDVAVRSKRRTLFETSNHPTATKEGTPRTPRLKLTRAKSMDELNCLSANQKQKIVEDRWAVKLIDIKSNVDHLTTAMGVIDISDDERTVSPRKNAKLSTAKRSLRVGNEETDEECLNYSIVPERTPTKSQSSPSIKIKLRVSQSQPHLETPKSSQRKRQPTGSMANGHVSPPKCRKSLLKSDVETKGTFDGCSSDIVTTVRTRRKSILKTPSTKTLEAVGTPKRNVHLSNIVEEFNNGRRVSRLLELTPKKVEPMDEEPKTPSRSARIAAAQTCKSTPRSASKMKLIRSGAIKPNIHARDAPLEDGTNELTVARARLHVSSVPTSLPCREKEYEEIYNFLESKIYDGCGGCMYVSGVPGTGKTATTTAVIRALQKLSNQEEIPKFDFIDINGMRLTEPRQAYVHIYRQLTGKTLAWEQAYNLLNKRFTTKAPRRVTTVLLVDELDILCNRRQDVVYNLLNWPTLPTAQLIVVTIANTMDLPERLLMGKIASRLGLTRLTFQPYNFRQLQEIVMARLDGTSSFNSDAVQLVARKVAAVSGDARRALDICRRATEMADEQSRKTHGQVTVSMQHVQEALAEMVASAKVKTIRSCSFMEQLFLQAVTAEVTRTGIEECNFLSVYAQFESLAAFSGITVPNPGRTLAICSRLAASRLLICESGKNDIYQKILLNISTDDVQFALQASKLL